MGRNAQQALYDVMGNPDSDLYVEWTAKLRYLGANMPVVGDIVRAQDNWNYWSDYLENRGMSWSDVLYPSRLSGAGSGYGAVSFVSSNIERLYR